MGHTAKAQPPPATESGWGQVWRFRVGVGAGHRASPSQPAAPRRRSRQARSGVRMEILDTPSGKLFQIDAMPSQREGQGLVLDNCEHLLEAAAALAGVLHPRTTIGRGRELDQTAAALEGARLVTSKRPAPDQEPGRPCCWTARRPWSCPARPRTRATQTARHQVARAAGCPTTRH
jgi:hypothetical protein